MLSVRSFLLASVVVLGACGGNSSVTARGSSDANNVAARATEPRSGDATAATPADPNATTSAGVTLPGTSSSSGTTHPAPSSSAAPSSTEPGDPSKPPPAPPKRVGARHVLVQWMGAERAGSSVMRSKEQALALAQDVWKRAKGGGDFARLAVEYSDEPGAGGRGGSLGRFGKGQMDPAFESAAFKLLVGEVSGVVETKFGYHVIQRTE